MARQQVVKYGDPTDLKMREMASRHPMRCVYPDSRFDEKSSPGGGGPWRPEHFKSNVAWNPPKRKARFIPRQAVNKVVTLAALKFGRSNVDIKGRRYEPSAPIDAETRAAWFKDNPKAKIGRHY